MQTQGLGKFLNQDQDQDQDQGHGHGQDLKIETMSDRVFLDFQEGSDIDLFPVAQVQAQAQVLAFQQIETILQEAEETEEERKEEREEIEETEEGIEFW